jgi:PAS domain S-box-containing protein
MGRETDWRFEQIVQESPDIIAIIDRQYRHTFVNEAIRLASGMGPADFEGKDHRELGMPEQMASYFQAVYRQVFETGQEGKKEFEFVSASGEVRSYASRVVPLIGPDGTFDTLLSCSRDVTERKREEESRLAIERKLQETQRLESLGLLAGGAAHDFNNLLTGIMGMTSLVQQRLGAAHAVQPLLSKVLLSCERAASLCTQMLAYAQLQRVAVESVSVAGLLELTCDLVRVSMPKNVVLTADVEQGVNIRADRTQIQQVLLNLLLNAVESIQGPGEVRVRTFRPDRQEQERELRDAVVVPADTTSPLFAIRVTDTGVGMDAATLSRIFEPFFTTKFTGRGLGLSATLGIVRAHGGGLTVRSEPGRGSEFTLYLALASEEQPVAEAPPSLASADGRILLVDDEPTVREVTAEILRGAGYEVAVAGSGSEALGLYDRDPGRSDLVLLDLTMPGLDGFQTLAELRTRDTRLPVVLMSGYAEQSVRDRAAADPALDFLQKPFRTQQLLDMCAGAVERGRARHQR